MAESFETIQEYARANVARRQLTVGLWRLAIVALCLPIGPAASALDPAQVVVLANANKPASLELARHYMQVRGIPSNHLCALDLPAGEVIARKYYNANLRDPLLAFLRARGLVGQVARDPKTVKENETAWTTVKTAIRCVVSIWGVPVRIAEPGLNFLAGFQERAQGPPRRTEAAVDSELTLLLYPPYPLEGVVSNPMYQRFMLEQSREPQAFFLIAARLDGPDPQMVRRALDDAIAAERYGLQGRAYFDCRGMRLNEYYEGDAWIREAGERFRRAGYECVFDFNDEMWGFAFPMEDAAVYMGWYTDTVVGPFLRTGFRFQPGAVAYHLHSASAAVLRSPARNWAGPLIARGAAAVMGAVREPYLAYTPQLEILADRLCAGYSFGESAYMALPAVSWQITVIGDPLYTPFKLSLDEQIQNLERDQRPEVDWAYVRKINLLVLDGRFNPALAYCRARLAERPGPVLREKLAELYARNELYEDAYAEFQKVLDEARTPETAIRVGSRLIAMLRMLGQTAAADKIAARVRERWPDSPLLPWLEIAGSAQGGR